MSRKKGRSTQEHLDLAQITELYGLSRNTIHKYFPAPTIRSVYTRHHRRMTILTWPKDVVEEIVLRPEIRKIIEGRQREILELQQSKEIQVLFGAYSTEGLISRARVLKRSFVLHVGPTNSGKTYQAIEDLKHNTPGTYLGPLRLLALEMYDRLNAAGVPCSMVTGEESLLTENAAVVSSTIELCNCDTHFRTAVIDEAQLIADRDRGFSWLRAICLVQADIVHICLAPEALRYIEGLIQSFGDPYSIVRHERLAPLRYAGHCRGYADLRDDDAIICFSRKSVLSTAALLEKNGFRASVIYGALPPEARRNEVRKYLARETTVVVATDAIGLGISLPIRRIIFAETEKFDGRTFRSLSTAEINQIAGRAGRYGMREYGEVLSMGEDDLIRTRLGRPAPAVKVPCIGFPREVLSTDYPLQLLLRVWQNMPPEPGFKREDMQDSLLLLKQLSRLNTDHQRELVYDLISCPIDSRSQELVLYWTDCACAILKKRRVPLPAFDTETLLGCELQYKAYDLRHQLLRRIGEEDDCSRERAAICQRIAELMRESKEAYIRRCRGCGRELPIGSISNYCQDCSMLERLI